jgi:hypothetical protein
VNFSSTTIVNAIKRRGNVLIDPATEAHGGAMQRRKRLAGLLSYYHRAA